MLETRDGGGEWLPRPVATAAAIDAVGAWDGDRAWAIGQEGARDALFVTVDGGVTWRRALDAPAPLSEPAGRGGSLWLVDGAGRVWTAPAPAGPWRETGAIGG